MNLILSEFLKNPVAFCGGFISGVLGWDLNQEPLRSWLADQGVYPKPGANADAPTGPQNISID
ncbi:MAG: hypothetical protein Q6K99_04520 [Thermostichales cyanobacterium BF4_bins_65]